MPNFKRDILFSNLAYYLKLERKELNGKMSSSTSTIKKEKRALLEKYLLESFDRYKSLLACDTDAIYAMDLDGYFVPLNPACESIFGYDAEQFKKLTYMKVVTLEHLDRALNLFYRSLEGKLQNFDCQIIHGNGMRLDLNITNYPIVINDEVVGVWGIAKDITEIKQKKRKLKENEVLYQLLTDNSLDLIVRSSADGTFLYVSPYSQGMLGYSPYSLIGRRVLDFIHNDDHEKVRNLFETMVDGQDQGRIMFRMKHQKGMYVWVEALTKAIFNENNIIEVISVVRDMTERLKAEEENRQREKSYRDIINHSPDAVVIAKHEKILFVNDTAVELIGAKSKKEVIGKNFTDFLDSNYYEIVKNRVKAVESGNAVDFLEEKLIKNDGKIIEVEVKAIPAIYQNEAARHIIIRDVTERKKTQEILLNSEKLSVAGQFAAGIAHEIRNPLTAIKGFLQLMEPNKNMNINYLDIINSEINRIELILSELLILSKPHESKFKKSDLKKILEHVKALIDAQAIMNNIEVEINYLSEIPNLFCDENQLKQVFINFLKNSIEATLQGGKIIIEAETNGPDHIKIRFIDKGCGIPSEYLDQIGQPFFTTKENGTGLGLMISKHIIKNHNGSIHITSNPDGTTVEVNLPLNC